MTHSKRDDSLPFMSIWRTYATGHAVVAEYHFARLVVGDGPGIRARLAAAGLGDWRFDFAWPTQRVAVEFDGGQWVAHGGRHNRDDDRDKLNHAAALGWRVLRFSNQQWADDPHGCCLLIRQALVGCETHA